jgi:hypothetical protein
MNRAARLRLCASAVYTAAADTDGRGGAPLKAPPRHEVHLAC